MYYYPFFLHFLNLCSFRHYNSVDENSIIINSPRKINLWSISRWSYARYRGTRTFMASYNYYTKNYEFDGKHFLSYDDVVNYALHM